MVTRHVHSRWRQRVLSSHQRGKATPYTERSFTPLEFNVWVGYGALHQLNIRNKRVQS